MTAANEGIDLRLLGPVRAWRDGAELTLGSARRTAVFSVLAVHANHAVSLEQLVAEVWGEDAPASAAGNVYTYVSALRQVLEPARGRWSAGQMLTSGGGSYCLHVDEQDIDVFRFEALREQGKRYRAGGDRLAECAALEAALRLWHGEALAGVPGPFAEAQRLRLAELHLATVERHAALLVELGRHDEAIAVLRALVAKHPLQESLYATLMNALHASGRPIEALNVHDQLRDVLIEEIGTEPGAALRTVRSRILAEVEAPRSAPAATPAADPASLIGRVTEIDLLQRAAADVAAGRGASLRFEGPPGIGKSALLHVALPGETVAGCRMGWGVGDELAQRMPLGVLVECIESANRGDTSRGLVRQLLDLAADALDDSDVDTLHRAVELIRHAAAEAPLILIADDLQWADAASLRVWAALHPLTRTLPLLLVAAARSGSDELTGLPADRVIMLPPLAPAAATALIRAVAPELRDPETIRRVLADAGGNPYYLRQLAMSRARDAAGERSAPPSDLVTAVGAHLAPLAEETRQILRAVAFLGNPCTVADVADVTGRRAEELLRVVAPAVAAGMLIESGPHLVFRHPIMAWVLHEGTPTALRVMLHRSFAERIAAAGGAPQRVVAQLLAGPVPLDDVASRWLVEHLAALSVQAPEDALTLLQRAWAQRTLSGEARMMLTPWLARLLFQQRRNAVAEAGWVAARTTDLQLEAEMLWIAACSHERSGEATAAADIARSVLSERRIPPAWLDKFRVMMMRLRPGLPGAATIPHMSRSMLLGGEVSVIG